MRTWWFLLFCSLILLIILPNASSQEQAIEKTFKEKGYEDFFVYGANKSECTSVGFLAQDLDKEYYPVISLKVRFLPVAKGDATVRVFLNNKRLGEFGPNDFICNDFCWLRLWLDRDTLVENNSLKVCASTSNTITTIAVSNDSIVGYYKMPIFREEDLFVSIDNAEPEIGEYVKVMVSLRNYGSLLAKVDLKLADPKLLAREERAFEVVGDTFYEVSIAPGEVKEFTYSFKPKKLGAMNIPRAVASYENVFGEEITLKSNIVRLNVVEEQQILFPEILIEDAINIVNDKVKVIIAIRNASNRDAHNVNLMLKAPGLVDANAGSVIIENIAANSTEYRQFEVSSEKAEDFSIGCELNYLGNDIVSFECEPVIMSFEEAGISPLVIQAAILLIIGLGIYAGIFLYLSMKKEESGGK